MPKNPVGNRSDSMTLLKGLVTPAAGVEKKEISVTVAALSLLLERSQQFGRLLALVGHKQLVCSGQHLRTLPS